MNHNLAFDRTPTMLTTPLRLQYETVWDALGRRLRQEYGAVCMACGHAPESKDGIQAHEVQSYPADGIIRLESVVLLCRKCHHAVHLDRSVYRAGQRGSDAAWRSGLKGRRQDQARKEAEAAYRAAMIEHYCNVNGVSPEQAEHDWHQAAPPKWLQQLRPSEPPTMDYGSFRPLIDGYLERKRMREDRPVSSLHVMVRKAAAEMQARYTDAQQNAMRDFVIAQAKRHKLDPLMTWAVQQGIFEMRGWEWFCWLRATHPKIDSLALQRGLDSSEWDPPADIGLDPWPYAPGGCG